MASPAEDVILTLENGITVRRLQIGDIASLSRHANNKNVTRWMRDRFPKPYVEEVSKGWIDFNADPQNQVRSGKYTSGKAADGPLIPANYAIAVDGEACGCIGIDFNSDIYFRSGELGYWLGEEHWGKGVMSRVVPAFVQWVWGAFGILVRIDSGCTEENVGSKRLLEKAGFVFEGRKANCVWREGKIGSELMFGALRPEGDQA